MAQTHVDGELAFLLRPIPSTMASDDAPVVIGGLPRLPGEMEWPRQADGVPTHFFAQFDLGCMPREQNGHHTPDFPTTGTLFVFLPLGEQGFHTNYTAQVLYTDAPTSNLPEQSPPAGLYNALEQDPSYLDPDGMTHDGTVLFRRYVDVLPFYSPLLSHQNRDLRLSENEEKRKRGYDEDKAQCDLHRKNMEDALRAARPLDTGLGAEATQSPSNLVLPYRYRRRDQKVVGPERYFDSEMLDWRFVFDWAKYFYRCCLRRTIKEMRRAETNWLGKWFIRRMSTRMEGALTELDRLKYNPGDATAPSSNTRPPDATLAFDTQAKQWLSLAATLKGPLPPHMQDAFVKMLIEVDRRADVRDAGGKRLSAEIEMLEKYVGGSSVDASTTITYATDAYEKALANEPTHVRHCDDGLSQVERWDLKLSKINTSAAAQPDQGRAVLGATPLQMFGRGDAIQNAVDDHIGDVLLMQIGEAPGLPLNIGQDMVVHLWIKPEDLASGCFDRVETTIEMT